MWLILLYVKLIEVFYSSCPKNFEIQVKGKVSLLTVLWPFNRGLDSIGQCVLAMGWLMVLTLLSFIFTLLHFYCYYILGFFAFLLYVWMSYLIFVWNPACNKLPQTCSPIAEWVLTVLCVVLFTFPEPGLCKNTEFFSAHTLNISILHIYKFLDNNYWQKCRCHDHQAPVHLNQSTLN